MTGDPAARSRPRRDLSNADTLLVGARILTVNAEREIIRDGAICVRKDRIHDVGPRMLIEERYPDALFQDVTGKTIVPGLINTHAHLFQTLLKGLGDDRSRTEWGVGVVRPSAVQLTGQEVYAAARHGCSESIRSGVTTLVDFAYGNPSEQLTEAVILAFEEIGMRGIVARGYVTASLHNGAQDTLLEDADEALADAERLIRAHNHRGGRVQVGFGPSMIWGVDERTLRLTRELADSLHVPITIHLAETRSDVDHALRTYGMSEAEFLEQIGFLGPDVLAVHCVHCSVEDIELLAAHDVKVSYNPISNMFLGTGAAPLPEMLDAGLTIGLGTDGAVSNNNLNMIQCMKFAALLAKGSGGDSAVLTRERVLEMATIEGARALGLDSEIGSIEPGKKADLVVMDLADFSVTPIHNAVSALVYSALGNEPEMVLIDGRIVMADRTLQTVSEVEVLREAERAAMDLAHRVETASLGS